jgi:50S ribosomal subunit-associated GTPase HflX
LDKIAGKQIITALNKSDLPAKFDTSRLPGTLSNTVQISAKEGTGIESLSEKIIKTAGAADFDLREPVSFTSRQENMLKKLTNAKSKQQVTSIITELLKGHV